MILDQNAAKARDNYEKKPQNNLFTKFSLTNILNKTLDRIKTEYKIDNFNKDLIEYVANYLDVFHNDFILTPSVLLESNTKITNEIRESIKSKLSEEAGINVVGITEINMGIITCIFHLSLLLILINILNVSKLQWISILMKNQKQKNQKMKRIILN